MTFRARLLLAFLAVVLIPVIVFALVVRREMGERLATQFERRVGALVVVIEEDLADESEAVGVALTALKNAVVDDNRFRRAAVDRDPGQRSYLLDYAGNAMRLTGLSMLQFQDEAGRIISSGHFRNEYDRLEPELPGLLAKAPGGAALVRARAPDSPFLALARVDSFRMGDRHFTVVGGVAVERRFLARLAREGDLTVSLVYPGGELSSGADRTPGQGAGVGSADAVASSSAVVHELAVPFIDAAEGTSVPARIRVTHPLSELQALRRNIDRWFLAVVGVTVLLAALLASWLSARISRPLAELADKTGRIDLDRLDIDFASRRKDEIGSLSRLLGEMTGRLRESAKRIRDAERRATLGELARQVNHDIKNGLMPIRNVLRHLGQLAREEPEQLARVMEERQGTIDSSIAYLEKLASNYARLTPDSERRPIDVNAVVRQVAARSRGAGAVELRQRLAAGRVKVLGDPVALRRILENLLDNALDSFGSGSGTISVSTETVAEARRPLVRIAVADTGCGMSEERVERIFEDFYTTKEGGTGLGLSIVRRLVMDHDGSIRVESEEGKGSRFTVELPLAEEASA